MRRCGSSDQFLTPYRGRVAKHAELRFYAGLRDFLDTDRRSGTVTRTFDVPGSVKDMIEACGVPHTEVAVVLANGEAVDFSYRVADRDRIAVYPPFYSFEIEPSRLVSPEPLPERRFVLDGHLSALARYLRLLGFDAVRENSWTDPELVAISVDQDRTLLTRDIGLLMHGRLTHGYFVRAIDPDLQLLEVVRRFELATGTAPFSRCMACNGDLRTVDKNAIADRLEPETRRHYDEFKMCADCDRIFWKGPHYSRLQGIVDQAING